MHNVFILFFIFGFLSMFPCFPFYFDNRPEPLKVSTAPTIAAAMPPTRSHIVLLVGEPVTVRDTLELNEFEASMP
jgi:hypothetical protein